MRSNIICSFAAALAVFAQFSAIFATFSLPAASMAGQPAHVAAADSVSRAQSALGIAEVVVEARQAI
jgi:hypothetical protein